VTAGEAPLADRIGGEAGKSIAASLHHVELLREKELKLEAARHEAETQVLHRVGAAYRAGEIDLQQLYAIYEHYKAIGLVGRKTRWDENVDVPWRQMTYLSTQLPNGPEGSWVGEYPILHGTTAPARGIAVVYVLFDEDNEPCYVGSTDQFRTRMTAHWKSGKRFVRWQAHPCRDRDHAYRLEDRLLKQHKPRLNRKASR
jgi:predicted GIY-YIG superfamily endonuclease